MKLSLVRPAVVFVAIARARAHAVMLVHRAMAWRWSKPIARVVLGACGLVLLALLGRSSLAGARAAAPTASAETAGVSAPATPASSAMEVAADAAPPPSAHASVPAGEAAPAVAVHRGAATPDDPVILNQASEEDLRRLPGIGQKRAAAIVSLRTKLGRFRQIEDLMRVKGIGRTTLKRLRPLLKLDAPPPPLLDAGVT
jgi:competence protein ComEA